MFCEGGLANLFFGVPDSKAFCLCGLWGHCPTAQPHCCCCSGKAVKGNTSANGCGCVLIKLCPQTGSWATWLSLSIPVLTDRHKPPPCLRCHIWRNYCKVGLDGFYLLAMEPLGRVIWPLWVCFLTSNLELRMSTLGLLRSSNITPTVGQGE